MTDVLTLRMAHASMQFSDTPKQQEHDVNEVFSRGYDIITGTETGPDNALHGLVARAAPGAGYRVAQYRAHFVAIRQSLFIGGWARGYENVIESTEGVGRHPDRGIAWLGGNTDGYGRLTVGAGHYLTHGRTPADPNYRLNMRYGKAVGDWAKRKGRGPKAVLFGADVNMPDNRSDVFFREPLTTCWDELGKWPDTGHGNIDVIASYDKDGRVKCRSARALPDRKVFLNTDHFLIEAVYEVKPKRVTR